MGYKYETQKDHFSFLPHRNFRRFSRRSSGEKLQNRAAAENRRGGGNHEKPRISRIGRSEHAALRATDLQQSRSSRSGETPTFAYIYCTNQLLNGFMRRLTRHDPADLGVHLPERHASGDVGHHQAQLRGEFWQHDLRPEQPVYGVTFMGAPFRMAWSKDAIMGHPFRDIRDGLTSTLMLSEAVQGVDDDLRGFAWWGDACNFTTFATPNTSIPDRIYDAAYCHADLMPLQPCALSTSTEPSRHSARSLHAGGVNAAMMDGSARFFSNDVNLTAWRAMGTSQGAEVFEGEE